MMAATKPKLCKRQKEDARQRFVTRVIQWAELMAEVKKLERRIGLAARDGVIDDVSAGNALAALECVIDDIREAVPEE